MTISDRYREQVRLLMRLLPLVAKESCFALKGGTAINLFVRDMPRLSVDIDLVYLPHEDRATALSGIDAAMKNISAAVSKIERGVKITPKLYEGHAIKITVQLARARVTIETSPVLRGIVFDPVTQNVAAPVEDAFGAAEIMVVSRPDLYAGKFMAALDRQNARDLFDVKFFFENDAIDDDIREAFLVYLISHNRPMHEVLSVRDKDITGDMERACDGDLDEMTDTPITPAELITARDRLVDELIGSMPEAHRAFLIGFEEGKPDWSLFANPAILELPAIRWRQMNLDKLPPQARASLVAGLRGVFEDSG